MLSVLLLILVCKANSTIINGGWSGWQSWSSECNAICGLGHRDRYRYCDNPTSSLSGDACFGRSVDYQFCHLKPCDGVVLANDGESCTNFCNSLGPDTSCNENILTANRSDVFTLQGVTCSSLSKSLWSRNFDPSYHAATSSCNGYQLLPSQVSCNETPPQGYQRLCHCYTPDDVGYSQWSSWGACSVECGIGLQYQTRYCRQLPCQGEDSRRRSCNERRCPVHGGYAGWSSWSFCNSTCEGGTQNRTRTCTVSVPMYGGNTCFNMAVQTRSCNAHCCPHDGGFSEWTTWTSCPVCEDPTYGRHHFRYRTCSDPPPMYNGSTCVGPYVDKMPCEQLPISEMCPQTLLKFRGVLTQERWKNEFLYPPNAIFNDLEGFISNSIFKFYEESLSSINDSINQVTVESFQLINNKFTAFIDITYNSFNKQEYVYLLEELDDHGSIQKLSIDSSSYKTYITPGFLANSSLWGEVPKQKPAILSASSVSSTTFEITWLAIDESNFEIPINETHNITLGGYHIYFRYVELRESFYEWRSVWMNETSTFVEGLLPGNVYKVFLLGYNAWGNGIPSEAITVKTLPQLPILPPIEPKITVTELQPGLLFIQWEKIPLLYMNGKPVSYNLRLIRDSTGVTDVRRKQLYDAYPRSVTVHVVPSKSYVIKICPENEVGEGIYCMKTTFSTNGGKITWNSFNIQVLPRPTPNSITISWDPIPFHWYYGDLIGYNVIYTLTKYGHYDLENVVTRNIVVTAFETRLTIDDLVFSGHYTISVQAINQKGLGEMSLPVHTENCICPSVLTTNYFMEKPYLYRDESGKLTGLFKDILNDFVDSTCGVCVVEGTKKRSTVDWVTNGKGNWAEKNTKDEATFDILGSADLSFPFFADDTTTHFSTGQFVPVKSYPGSLLLTMAPAFHNFIATQIKEVASTLPFILFMLFFVIIFGVCIWLCERTENSDQFHPDFLRGALMQGSYWAYVTMTTVGYGDKHAITVKGRIFAMLWILASMVMVGIFTGSVTSVIMKSEQSKFDFHLMGSKISVLKNTIEHDIVVSAQAKDKAYFRPENVSSALFSRRVDGALISVYEAAINMDLFNLPNMIALRTIETEKSYGIVIGSKLSTSADFFKSTMKGNSSFVDIALKKYMPSLQLNLPEFAETTSLTSFTSPQMKVALLALLLMLIVFSATGAFLWYGVCRKWKRSHTTEETRRRLKVSRDARREFTEMIEKWKKNIIKRMNDMELKHLDERIKIWKNLKPGIHDSLRASNYDIKTFNMNRPFIAS